MGNNVKAACIAHITRHTTASFTSMYGAAATPAQVATQCGYPGSKASAWRQYLARQHGQGAVRTGHGRYPALTLAQWQALLGIVQAASKATPGTKAATTASQRVGRVLYKQQAASKAGKRQAKRQAQAAPAPAPAEPTVQATPAS